jgi:hypothetical protein
LTKPRIETISNYAGNHKGVATGVALGIFLIFCWLWSVSAPIRGNLAARVDAHRGRYQVLGFGLPTPWRPEYARCLRERYGIEYRPVAGCIVSESLVSYVHAYHSVTSAATHRKFGRDVFRECAEEAEKNWKERADQTKRDATFRQ